MLTGLIPRHFDDCLPFSMFTIADINTILTFGSLTLVTNTTLHNPDHTLLSFGKKTLPAAVYPP